MPLRKLRALKSKAISMRGSLLRAGVFAVAWMILPWWLFIPVALYLYFVPLSQAKIAAAPFITLLALCFVQPTGWCAAVIFGVIFLYVLLIKDLYIINRKSAYEMLSLILMFLLVRIFYLDMAGQAGVFSILCAFVVAALFASLVSGFVSHFSPDAGAPVADATTQKPLRRTTTLIALLLFFQFLIVGLFLPLDFIYQSVVVFLIGTLIIEFFPYYLFGTFSRTKLLTTSSVVFTLLVLVLGSARWGL